MSCKFGFLAELVEEKTEVTFLLPVGVLVASPAPHSASLLPARSSVTQRVCRRCFSFRINPQRSDSIRPRRRNCLRLPLLAHPYWAGWGWSTLPALLTPPAVPIWRCASSAAFSATIYSEIRRLSSARRCSDSNDSASKALPRPEALPHPCLHPSYPHCRCPASEFRPADPVPPIRALSLNSNQSTN